MRRAIAIAFVVLAACVSAPAQAATPFVHFRSPSGAINCIGGSTPVFVDCLVRGASWAKPPAKPARCDLDWDAYELGLVSRTVSIGACRGDVGPRCFHDCTTLRYGKSLNIGPIRCRSAANGITCRYVRGTLAGFRIARDGYIVWRR
ncbi:MAG: hypothetical protein QOD37_562, partial [Gaiellales bacterium]|nr:hypothetical protein [Gaiellales bacterium]